MAYKLVFISNQGRKILMDKKTMCEICEVRHPTFWYMPLVRYQFNGQCARSGANSESQAICKECADEIKAGRKS